MKVVFSEERERFEAISTFSENPILKQAVWCWDPDPAVRRWFAPHDRSVPRLRSYMDEDAKRRFDQGASVRHAVEGARGGVDSYVASFLASPKAKANIAASSAADSAEDFPCPAGLSYLPFQKAGIAFALGRTATLIADEQGLGKTIQAIGVVNVDPSAKKVLVVCPAGLKINWKDEFKKWLVRKLSTGILGEDGAEQCDIQITNFESLKKHADHLRSVVWDLLIVDECHYLKSPKAQRTQYLLGTNYYNTITPIEAKRKLFLSGTPMLNRPVELWPLVRAIDPRGLGFSWKVFITRYCGAFDRTGWHGESYGTDTNGATNLAELQNRMRATFMVRRLKADVLKDLPAKRRQVIPLEADAKTRKLAEKEKKAYETFEGAKSGKLKGKLTIPFNEMSAARKETALAKLPMVIAHVVDLLEEEELPKLVIFYHHHEVGDGIAAALRKKGLPYVQVDGRTTLARRDAAIKGFQGDMDCRVFLGSIKAAGTGITLTAADTCVFAEIDWVPSVLDQCEDRLHRIGQEESVLVQHLVLEGSLDHNLLGTIVKKQRVISKALDGPRGRQAESVRSTVLRKAKRSLPEYGPEPRRWGRSSVAAD